MLKKLISIFILFVIISGVGFSQAKVNLYLSNPAISNPGGYWKMDIMATVPAGQNWRVGSSNIRVDWVTFPANAVSIKADNPVINPNPNLHNNANYSVMTTTSILGGTAISLNIARLNSCYTLTTGTYKLGEIRFNRLDTNGCIRFNIRTNSVLQDSITQMVHPAGWTFTTDTTCRRLDFLVGTETTADILPKEFKLYNNYPNPFNPVTHIKYDVPVVSSVKLYIYDLLGKEIAMLVNEKLKQPGRYEVKWDASKISSGTYFYRLESDKFTDVKKMILIK